VPARRRELIAERLKQAGSVSVAALEEEFGISSMTARRDLHVLEREGRARRTHGGAVVPTAAAHEDSFSNRLAKASEEKERIGLAACAHVGDGEAVFVDSSTTAYIALRCLIDSGRRMTVLTNSVPAMDLVAQADAPNVDLIGLSGSLRKATRSFVGPRAIEAIRAHYADKLLFSVNGISSAGVLTEADALEAEVKREMVERANDALLLLDGSKFDHTGLSTIVDVRAVHSVLVAGASRDQLKLLRTAGVAIEEVR
jgi:DeoR/GlpR family transcriptional regulator of sugar metabolism